MRKVGGIHPKIGHFLVNREAFIEQTKKGFLGILGLEQWALAGASRPLKQSFTIRVQPRHHPEAAQDLTVLWTQNKTTARGQNQTADADLLGKHPVLHVSKICFPFSGKDFRY